MRNGLLDFVHKLGQTPRGDDTLSRDIVTSQSLGSNPIKYLIGNVLFIILVDELIEPTAPVHRDLSVHGIVMTILLMEDVAGNHVTNDLIQDIVSIDKSLLELKDLPGHIVNESLIPGILTIHTIFDPGNRVGFEVPDIYILRNVPDFISTTTNDPVKPGI